MSKEVVRLLQQAVDAAKRARPVVQAHMPEADEEVAQADVNARRQSIGGISNPPSPNAR